LAKDAGRHFKETPMDFVDRMLPCDTCGGSFVWTAGEQEFFAQREFSAPRRCSGARKARKTGGPVRYDECPFGSSSGAGPVDRGPRTDRRPAPASRPTVSGERVHGTVVRVITDKGFGFVRDAQDQDYYFNERDVPIGSFSRLTVGDELDFVVSESARGKRAQEISLRT
jgi:cold shock CspA family protein